MAVRKGIRFEDLPKEVQDRFDAQERQSNQQIATAANEQLPSHLRRGLVLLYMWLMATALLIVWVVVGVYKVTRMMIRMMFRITIVRRVLHRGPNL